MQGPVIYIIAPHPDDAVLSLGGWMQEQLHRGASIKVINVFCDDRQPERIAQELACARYMGYETMFLKIPDAPLRYTGFNQINTLLFNSEVPHFQNDVINMVSQKIAELLLPAAKVVFPLGVGGHIDHLIVRRAGERLGAKAFYAEMPYSLVFDNDNSGEFNPSAGSHFTSLLQKNASADKLKTYRAQYPPGNICKFELSEGQRQTKIAGILHHTSELDLLFGNAAGAREVADSRIAECEFLWGL